MRATRNITKTGRGVRADRDASASGRRTVSLISCVLAVLIFFVTVLAFLPALENGFVEWDDDKVLLNNPYYRGLNWTQLSWMFTTFHMGHYQPLTWVTFGLDYLLWGMDPFGYHLTSLLLHSVNAVLFYLVGLRLLSAALLNRPHLGDLGLRIVAAFGAIVFAIHPLRVESVAWATERRDVLSGLFFFLTLLCYLRAVMDSERTITRWRWLIAAWVVYALSLLSKASGMTLPVVLLLLDVYPLGRIGAGPGRWLGPEVRRVWWEKVLFFLLALAAGVIALFAQHEARALRTIEEYGVLSRLGQAVFGVAFYLWKTIIPIRLSPLYELPQNFSLWDWRVMVGGVVALAGTCVLLLLRDRWRAGLAIWIYYLVVLAPVLGIAQSGPQMAADRYTYLSCLGWSMLAGAGIFYLWERWVRGDRDRNGEAVSVSTLCLFAGLSLGVLAVLGTLTWRQAQVWHDSESLWRHVLAVGPKSSYAHTNLGALLVSRGKIEEGIGHYRQAIEINPAYPTSHNNLGIALARQGKVSEAEESYRQALRLKPIYVLAHYNLANLFVAQGKLKDAERHYREAISIEEGFADAHNNLATVLAEQGQLKEAIHHFRRALELSPASDIHLNLGRVLASEGDRGSAMGHFREALKLQPDFFQAYYYLGLLRASQGHLDEAIDRFRQALRIQPEFAEAHESLARALAQQGKRDEAARHFEEALRILKSRRKAQEAR